VFSKLFLKQTGKQQTRQATFVVLFVAGLLFAQLATVFHDADHAFHEHTHLCDVFTAYGHGKNLPVAVSVPDFSVGTFSVFYAFTVRSPLLAQSAVIRIRGPPDLSV